MRSPEEPNEFELNMIRNDEAKVALIRQRLSDISWWMRLLCQSIAQKASRLTKEQATDEKESVNWIPHRIDDASGVGTDVCVVDINGDEAPDVIVGNKKGTFASVQKR